MNDTVKTVPETLRDAAVSLAVVSDTARLDAELLMAFSLGIDRSALLLEQRDLVVPDAFTALVVRRMKHEPVAYITGHQSFWDLELLVTPDVLIPRSDSETVIEAAIAAFAGGQGPARILDLGTGSGALLLAALSCFPEAQGLAVDAIAKALVVARSNAENLGFAERARFLDLNWRDAGWMDAVEGPYALILCNPPYVESGAALSPMVANHEPHTALFAGAEGLDDYRMLIPALPELLAQDGVAIFEIGHRQADAVTAIAAQTGLKSELHHDLAGKPRALTFRRALMQF
jgi:release factor glutamine methyltransferase